MKQRNNIRVIWVIKQLKDYIIGTNSLKSDRPLGGTVELLVHSPLLRQEENNRAKQRTLTWTCPDLSVFCKCPVSEWLNKICVHKNTTVYV